MSDQPTALAVGIYGLATLVAVPVGKWLLARINAGFETFYHYSLRSPMGK